MDKPRVLIVSPALASDNNGNAHTASRWQRFLAELADVRIARRWEGEPVDALIALHARRSAESIGRFSEANPARPLALVLTGTDLYVDLEQGDASARRSLDCATHVVVLQNAALTRLEPAILAKTRVIVQSAERIVAAHKTADFVAVGHLRDVKDPLTLMSAARLVDVDSIRVVHVGAALDAALGEAALRTARECPRYRWIGSVSSEAARQWIAGARALVHMSRAEGGAHVLIEAVRSGVPVLASRIDGNLGLLGEDYEGYFPAGDANALARLMTRFAVDAAFARRLAVQCEAREERFAPEREAAAVQDLLHAMLAPRG